MPFDAGEEAVDGGGGDAGVVLKLLGGACGERAADDPVARCLPGVAGGVQGEGLAGAGNAFDDVDTGAGATDRAHHRLLLAAQRRPSCHCSLDGAVGGHGRAGVTAAFGTGDETGL